MNEVAGSGEKSLVRGVGRTSVSETQLQKGFPTANNVLARNKMPTEWIILSMFEVDNISHIFSLWKFFGSLIISLAVDRWQWGNLYV